MIGFISKRKLTKVIEAEYSRISKEVDVKGVEREERLRGWNQQSILNHLYTKLGIKNPRN